MLQFKELQPIQLTSDDGSIIFASHQLDGYKEYGTIIIIVAEAGKDYHCWPMHLVGEEVEYLPEADALEVMGEVERQDKEKIISFATVEVAIEKAIGERAS